MDYNMLGNRYRNTVLSCLVCMRVVLVALSERDAIAVMNREDDAPRVMFELMVCSTCHMAIDLPKRLTLTVLNIDIVISTPKYKLVTTLLGYEPEVWNESGRLFMVPTLECARERLVDGHLITKMTDVTDTAMTVDEVTDFL